jgi:hypothetical protein
MLSSSWFRSYLTNRIYFISVNGTESGEAIITCGVLQASAIRPLLFLLYINEMLCSPRGERLFADDTNLFIMG